MVWLTRRLPILTALAISLVIGLAPATAQEPAVGALPANAVVNPPQSAGSVTTRPIGTLQQTRWSYTATRLLNGTVLFASGTGSGSLPFPSLEDRNEIFDPVRETFTLTGSTTLSRFEHTATLLPDGSVLLVGMYLGLSGPNYDTPERYLPNEGRFVAENARVVMRSGHTATLLDDGTVLLVGGRVTAPKLNYYPIEGPYKASVYDPATDVETPAPMSQAPRVFAAAARLWDGRVLVTGGGQFLMDQGCTASAEVYDLATRTFTPTGSMATARVGHAMATLPDGNVLVAGGPEDLVEIYDAAQGVFRTIGRSQYPYSTRAQMVALGDESILIVYTSMTTCGFPNTNPNPALTWAERYDPSTGQLQFLGTVENRSMNEFTLTALSGNRVLLTSTRYVPTEEGAQTEAFILEVQDKAYVYLPLAVR